MAIQQKTRNDFLLLFITLLLPFSLPITVTLSAPAPVLDSLDSWAPGNAGGQNRFSICSWKTPPVEFAPTALYPRATLRPCERRFREVNFKSLRLADHLAQYPADPEIFINGSIGGLPRLSDIIDIDMGGIILDAKMIERMEEEIPKLAIHLASGETGTKAEFNAQNDFIPWKRGVSL